MWCELEGGPQTPAETAIYWVAQALTTVGVAMTLLAVTAVGVCLKPLVVLMEGGVDYGPHK